MKDALIAAAREAQNTAYAPYSRYAVGAALLDEHGAVHSGSNVENVSYPVGMCAERCAIAHLIRSGARKIRAVAVATPDGGTPCGMCLQAISEFADEPTSVTVTTCAEDGSRRQYTLAELLPHGFRSDSVG